jgi:hypothetical protein
MSLRIVQVQDNDTYTIPRARCALSYIVPEFQHNNELAPVDEDQSTRSPQDTVDGLRRVHTLRCPFYWRRLTCPGQRSGCES